MDVCCYVLISDDRDRYDFAKFDDPSCARRERSRVAIHLFANKDHYRVVSEYDSPSVKLYRQFLFIGYILDFTYQIVYRKRDRLLFICNLRFMLLINFAKIILIVKASCKKSYEIKFLG